ncbi:hypothetical protein ABEB36_009777 [Hypothenemus hampei]|uniref:Uncharacterized protein n=1 Tax=Hypothenemus hampei TaxID=57062 RepID=A0ABD1EHZ1_HYPHA
MKCFIVIFLASFPCLTLASPFKSDEHWMNFKSKYGKVYENLEEESRRLKIFQENIINIESHNDRYAAGQETYKMGINKFGDQSPEEFLGFLKHKSGQRSLNKEASKIADLHKPDLPNATDWREMNAVTPVRDQKNCAASWAFSVTGSLEGFYHLRYKRFKSPVAFSVQQLIDCDEANYGCYGGNEASAMDYFTTFGIETDSAYPYVALKNLCQYNQSIVFAHLESFIPIEPEDEQTILIVVGFLGPVSVAIDATRLQFYESGIFSDNTCSKTTTNHAVLAVGYNKDNTTDLDYWIVKNSWGTSWGEDGYFKIKRGVNECAFAMEAVYPSFGIQP